MTIPEQPLNSAGCNSSAKGPQTCDCVDVCIHAFSVGGAAPPNLAVTILIAAQCIHQRDIFMDGSYMGCIIDHRYRTQRKGIQVPNCWEIAWRNGLVEWHPSLCAALQRVHARVIGMDPNSSI